jgi:hypothetical protein
MNQMNTAQAKLDFLKFEKKVKDSDADVAYSEDDSTLKLLIAEYEELVTRHFETESYNEKPFFIIKLRKEMVRLHQKGAANGIKHSFVKTMVSLCISQIDQIRDTHKWTQIELDTITDKVLLEIPQGQYVDITGLLKGKLKSAVPFLNVDKHGNQLGADALVNYMLSNGLVQCIATKTYILTDLGYKVQTDEGGWLLYKTAEDKRNKAIKESIDDTLRGMGSRTSFNDLRSPGSKYESSTKSNKGKSKVLTAIKGFLGDTTYDIFKEALKYISLLALAILSYKLILYWFDLDIIKWIDQQFRKG